MNFGGIYREALSQIVNAAYWLIWIIPLVIIAVSAFVIYRNKKIYVHPVRIFKVRENGKVIETNHKGGFIKRKGSGALFRIKKGRWWWQYVDLITTPKPEYMDEQNRVYLKQIDVDTFVQLRRYFDESGNVHFSPVESDVKYGAILSINRINQLTSTEPTWKRVMPYAGMVLVFSLAVVIFALMMNAKCPVCS